MYILFFYACIIIVYILNTMPWKYRPVNNNYCQYSGINQCTIGGGDDIPAHYIYNYNYICVIITIVTA